MACWCKGSCPVVRGIKEKMDKGNRSAAERTIKQSLIDAPNCVEANLWLAEILNFTNRAYAGETHIRRAKATLKGETPIRIALAEGRNFYDQTKMPTAVRAYARALELCKESAGNPSHDAPRAHHGYIMSLRANNQIDAAEAAAIEALKHFPENPMIKNAAAAVTAERGNFELAAVTVTQAAMRPVDLFDRGRYFDRLGRHSEAWADWMHAKAMLRRRHPFQREAFDDLFSGLFDMATKQRQATIPYPFENSSWLGSMVSPLFVTGFMRSGTTMFETALAAHSKIAAADELDTLPNLTRAIPAMLGTPAPYPFALVAASWGENIGAVGRMRDLYMAKAEWRGNHSGDSWARQGVSWFTDKMPLNEVHLPLMVRLFPDAAIFRMQRHPLDTMVSNMSYDIGHFHCNASSLESCAYAYAAVDRLVQKYKTLWPERVTEIRYESFVADHRDILNAAFIQLGLEPEEAAYEFHKSDRISRTISHRQIKEPVYDRSIGRWKNYREQLAPAIEVLRPIIEREGYEL